MVSPASATDGSSVTVLPAETVAKDALLARTISAELAKYGLRPRILFLPAGTVMAVGVADAELARVAVALTEELVEETTLKLMVIVSETEVVDSSTTNTTGTTLPTNDVGKLTVTESPPKAVANATLLETIISIAGALT